MKLLYISQCVSIYKYTLLQKGAEEGGFQRKTHTSMLQRLSRALHYIPNTLRIVVARARVRVCGTLDTTPPPLAIIAIFLVDRALIPSSSAFGELDS